MELIIGLSLVLAPERDHGDVQGHGVPLNDGDGNGNGDQRGGDGDGDGDGDISSSLVPQVVS